MASDALAVTGEDHLVPFENGFALDTDDPCEIIRCLDWVPRDPRWADVTERLFIALGVADDR